MSFASPLEGITPGPHRSSDAAVAPPDAAIKENKHLRRLLAERDVLCATLKVSLERAARAQEASIADTKRLRQRIAELVAGRARHVIGVSDVDVDPDELPMPTREEEIEERRRAWEDEEAGAAAGGPASILSVWSQVLFGK